MTFTKDPSLSKDLKAIVSDLDRNSDDVTKSLPLTIDLDKLGNTQVTLSGETYQTQNWYFITNLEGELQISANPENKTVCEASVKSRIVSEINIFMRLILLSYQKLSEGDHAGAIALTEKAINMNPEIAAPHTIAALSYIAKSERQSARIALEKAIALDPGDQNLKNLLARIGKE